MTSVTLQEALGLASRQQQAGQLAAAESTYRAILAQHPNDPDALYGLSAIAHHMGRPDSLALMEASLAIRPDVADAQLNYGNLLQNAGRLNDAVNAFRRAMALAPDMPEAYNGLGSAMAALGRTDDAIASYQVALRLRPNSGLMWSNLGNAHFDAGRVEQAMECHRRAIALDPTFPEGHNNLAVALQELGQYELSMDSARASIALRPTYAEAHQNLGLLLLMRGEFAAGWAEYEWRWKRADLPGPRKLPQPQWDGSPGRGTILVHAEQGLGDTLQFARYLPSVKQRGWRVIIECVAGQESLLAESAAGLGIDQVIARPRVSSGTPLPPVGISYDVQVPMMSLPLALGEYAPSSPAITKPPYLVASAERRERWHRDQRLAGRAGLKVGLVWAGRPQHRADGKRSIHLSNLKPLAMEGVTLYGLQVGPTAAVWGSASGPDVPLPIIDLAGDIRDFADSAALLSELDLLITVDTAAAHLAGALARPAWVLLSHVADFRWLLNRTDSPWYPSLRLYRQPGRGDWASVIARVADDLAALARSAAERSHNQPVGPLPATEIVSDPAQGSLPEFSCRN
jgi:tetratricopeptide (TPR) repeat protein